MSVGVISPGEYHFGTEEPERLTVVSGELEVLGPDGAWRPYAAGTTFEVAGSSGFDVRAASSSSYLCEYL